MRILIFDRERFRLGGPVGDRTLFDEFDNFVPSRLRSTPARPSAVGLLTTDRVIWVVVANRPGVESDEIDRPARGEGRPMRICHEVLPDGRVRLGEIDPERESILSEILDEG